MTLGVCGGGPVIVRTRISVWLLVEMRNAGMSDVDILRGYPSLRTDDLANAWAYYNVYKDEIDRQIEENENA